MIQVDSSDTKTQSHIYRAGFFRRLIAQLIDCIIYLVYYYNVMALLSSNILRSGLNSLDYFRWYDSVLLNHPTNLNEFYIRSLVIVSVLIIFIGLSFVLPAIFYLRYVQKTGATIGKKLLKLKIISVKGSISFWRIFLREIIFKPISLIYFGLGFFWIIWDKDHQAWHDKFVKTYVVSPVAPRYRPRWGYIFMIVILTTVLGVFYIFNNYYENELRKYSYEYFNLSEFPELLNIQDALYDIEKRNTDGALLCNGVQGYCEGNNKEDSQNLSLFNADGTGWIKVNFQQLGYENTKHLPFGNSKIYNYCSDGKNWEISILNQSLREGYDRVRFLAENDGGNNPAAFELGSNKTLCR